jgi:DNA-binding transcriptional MerR regulator
MDEQYNVTTSQAAQICGVSRNTIMYYVRKGRITPRKFGVRNYVRFTLSDVSALRNYIKENQAPPTIDLNTVEGL